MVAASRTKVIVMLRHTFIHLPGIGPHRERKLWDQGILDWDGFLNAATSGVLSKKMCESAVPLVRKSLEAIAAGDPRSLSRAPAYAGDVAAVSRVCPPGVLPGH